LCTRDVGLDRAADQLAATAEDRDRRALGRTVGEQGLLGAAARMDERALLQRIELLVEIALDDRSEREVDVVAPEQDVIADRDALERERATIVGDLDQREIGGAASDVAHEHDITGLEVLAPLIAPRGEVRVERGLRLLEQRDLLEPGLAGRDDRELAGDRVEARRYGDQDFLLVGRFVLVRLVPRGAQVREVACGCIDGRDALATGHRLLELALRAAERQYLRGAIDRRVAQPRLRRRDEPVRQLRPAIARERAHRVA
jgi:hypothetical protein